MSTIHTQYVRARARANIKIPLFSHFRETEEKVDRDSIFVFRKNCDSARILHMYLGSMYVVTSMGRQSIQSIENRRFAYASRTRCNTGFNQVLSPRTIAAAILGTRNYAISDITFATPPRDGYVTFR